jgi:hypothetical protein
MSLSISLNHPTPKELISINQELSRSKLPAYNYNKNMVLPSNLELPYISWSFSGKYYYKNLKIIAAKLCQDPGWITVL